MSRAMKDSGIPWASEIPVSWDIKCGKWVLNQMQRAVRDDDEVVTCFRDGEVILRSLRRTDGFTMSDKEIGYQGINTGDIVIHGMDGFAGAMGISKSQGKSTPVYVVCTTRNNHNERYIIYYLRSLAHNDVFLALSTGIRERSCDLKWNKISVLPFILPNHTEQRVIADFLDVKCAEVDELVALQQKMIDELKVYKQSVITEAVTKGLNPNATLKDSGVEWVGQIPEHWEIKRIKDVCISNSSTLSDNTRDDYEFSYVDIGSVNFENGIISSEVFMFGNAPSRARKTAKLNDIIVSTVRTYLRAIDIVDTEAKANYVYSTGFAILSPRKNSLSKFIIHICRSEYFTFQVSLLSNGINYPSINNTNMNCISVFMPPIEEQQQIADYLDTKCAEIDEMTAIKQQKIEQLKEYKKSIIYEYVTGKKQVNF